MKGDAFDGAGSHDNFVLTSGLAGHLLFGTEVEHCYKIILLAFRVLYLTTNRLATSVRSRSFQEMILVELIALPI